MKLVQHVCRHIDVPTVLSDALLLCDAFTHISKLDTSVLLLQRTMVTPNNHVRSSSLTRVEQCASLLLEIYSVDAMLADAVGERLAGFCAIVLEDCKKMILRKIFVMNSKRQAMMATATACALLSVMRDQSMRKQFCRCNSIVARVATTNLLEAFQKVSKLQSGCNIFLTLDELKDPACCATVVSDLLLSVDVLLSRRVVSEMEEDYLRDELRRLVATARQWCTILCKTPSQVSQMWSRVIGIAACRVAKISTNHASILLLEVSGLIHEQTGHSSFHAIMSVALTLCARSVSEAHHLLSSTSQSLQNETHLLPSLISMRCMAQASQLLREHILLHSPPCRLSSSLSFANLAELICEISIRSDMGIGERLEKYIDTLKTVCRKIHQQSDTATGKPVKMLADKRLTSSPNLHPTWYIGDGLLLQPFEALGISMLYWKVMLDVETKGYCESDLRSSNPLAEESQTVQSLESSGAHAIAHRVIMLSATTSMCQISSSCSEYLMSGSVEIILRKNYRVLAERSLGGTDLGLTSGTVDALMSVSFLLHLPKEMAFKVSKYFHIITTLILSDCILTCTSVNFNISRSTKHHCRRL